MWYAVKSTNVNQLTNQQKNHDPKNQPTKQSMSQLLN